MASETDETHERHVNTLEDKNFIINLIKAEDNDLSLVQQMGKSEVWNRFERIYYKNIETIFVKCKYCDDIKRQNRYIGTGNLLRHKCQPFLNYCQSEEAINNHNEHKTLNNNSHQNDVTFDELILPETNEEFSRLIDKNFLLSLIKSNDNRLSFETQSGKSDVWTRFERIFFNNCQTIFVKCKYCNDIQRQTRSTGTGNLLRHKCKNFATNCLSIELNDGKDDNFEFYSKNTPILTQKVIKKCSSVEEKIRLENKTLKNIIKKCLAMIDKCICFESTIVSDKKDINVLINDYNEWLFENQDFEESNEELDDNTLSDEDMSGNETDIKLNITEKTDCESNERNPIILNTYISKPKFGSNYPKRVYKKCSPDVIHENITYVCDSDNCGKVFKKKRGLQEHKRDIHSMFKKYHCLWPGCDAAFHKKVNYDLHTCSHTNEKKFICDWPDCSYKTCRPNLLIRHRRSHTGEKPYKCDWPGCEFKSSLKQGLDAHKYRHTGEKPWKCSWPQCEWSFRQPTHLKAHMLKHTGEKPFVCEFNGCDRRFSSRQAMRFHLEKSHNFVNNK